MLTLDCLHMGWHGQQQCPVHMPGWTAGPTASCSALNAQQLLLKGKAAGRPRRTMGMRQQEAAGTARLAACHLWRQGVAWPGVVPTGLQQRGASGPQVEDTGGRVVGRCEEHCTWKDGNKADTRVLEARFAGCAPRARGPADAARGRPWCRRASAGLAPRRPCKDAAATLCAVPGLCMQMAS
jgi:hypothetical protein